MKRRIALALLHHPVLDRAGEVVTTSMTNMDLHDMSRSAKSYGLEAMYVVHPIEAQRELVRRIREHWVEGSGKNRIPDRAVALELLRCVVTFEEALADLGPGAEIWTTAAQARGPDVVPYKTARARLESDGAPIMIVFGTGWGLAPSVIDAAAVRLEPIAAAEPTGYNHLSVRAACAITLDRLLG
jgi:hypothetical protein